MVSPLACGVEASWERLLAGECAAKPITAFKADDLACRIAMNVPRGDGTNGTFNPDHWMDPKDQRKVDDFILFAVGAATQALDDADWHPSTDEDQIETGVMTSARGSAVCKGIAETRR